MALDANDFECVAALVEGYLEVAIAERDARIEQLTARVAALEAGRNTSAAHASDFPDLADICDPYGKLPQTRARRRQHFAYHAERMRGYIGEDAYMRVMATAAADHHEDRSHH